MDTFDPEPYQEFQDRSTGLMVFGILTILLGGLTGLLVPLMVVMQVIAAKSGAPSNLQAVAPAIAMYGSLAVALVWLGIGSTLARRWARALLLVLSWSGLAVGAGAIVLMALVLPTMMETIQASQPAGHPPIPPAAKLLLVVIPLVVITVVFIVLPGVWLFFYRSPHVKATCEARDPVVRWTDGCPLPVLGMSVWLAIGSLMLLVIPLTQGSVMPFFGRFLTGVPATMVCVAYAGVWGWCARAVYRLDVRGWWILVVGIAALTTSHLVTYAQRDVGEMYELMGFTEEQLAQVKRSAQATTAMMMWSPVVFGVPFAAYLVYLKRFFRRAE